MNGAVSPNRQICEALGLILQTFPFFYECDSLQLLICVVHVNEDVGPFRIIGAQVIVYIGDIAEATAIVRLVACVGSLIDLSARVVSRLHEFNSKTSDILESFRSLSIWLSLLTATL